ncbi:MAG TPA: helix-hairpin-helix domain-containing protein [Flavobacteriaceae bacterium]|nr:helix-hairpin-helix domain-containing protein [Flavobacteriaceae bacterium]MCB9213986.1 helix-hairpin-helix domain-containing protein [Alteromonas sp.]HPF11855.1 helix-hairpin-helix domain-containing protein [Flavobacteriaceae bacterium]HQU21132.1 helix-hairpin-helix domain-containing protein [Flavobacteriaceae bacterium]HQU65332.1 helix-hairpin-helix domain-containing protein [Flavobacteriaceae bacterium]
MFFKKWTYQFRYTHGEQAGILLLCSAIIALLFLNNCEIFNENTAVDINSTEVLKLQQLVDSLKVLKKEEGKYKVYPFNPNFITDFKAYTLGMSPMQFDKLKAYRDQGKWINSVADFKKVTGVDEVWLDSISPLFKFPDWVSHPKPKSKTFFKKEKSFNEKTDLNLATVEDLEEVYGIGPAFSKRILEFREKLGGFSDEVQLYFVYGLKPETVENVLKDFTVKTPKEITKMNINKVSASDIATLPGISFSLAKDIWEFVQLREGISKLGELTKIEGMSPQKLALIELYLFAE